MNRKRRRNSVDELPSDTEYALSNIDSDGCASKHHNIDVTSSTAGSINKEREKVDAFPTAERFLPYEFVMGSALVTAVTVEPFTSNMTDYLVMVVDRHFGNYNVYSPEEKDGEQNIRLWFPKIIAKDMQNLLPTSKCGTSTSQERHPHTTVNEAKCTGAIVLEAISLASTHAIIATPVGVVFFHCSCTIRDDILANRSKFDERDIASGRVKILWFTEDQVLSLSSRVTKRHIQTPSLLSRYNWSDMVHSTRTVLYHSGDRIPVQQEKYALTTMGMSTVLTTHMLGEAMQDEMEIIPQINEVSSSQETLHTYNYEAQQMSEEDALHYIDDEAAQLKYETRRLTALERVYLFVDMVFRCRKDSVPIASMVNKILYNIRIDNTLFPIVHSDIPISHHSDITSTAISRPLLLMCYGGSFAEMQRVARALAIVYDDVCVSFQNTVGKASHDARSNFNHFQLYTSTGLTNITKQSMACVPLNLFDKPAMDQWTTAVTKSINRLFSNDRVYRDTYKNAILVYLGGLDPSNGEPCKNNHLKLYGNCNKLLSEAAARFGEKHYPLMYTVQRLGRLRDPARNNLLLYGTNGLAKIYRNVHSALQLTRTDKKVQESCILETAAYRGVLFAIPHAAGKSNVADMQRGNAMEFLRVIPYTMLTTTNGKNNAPCGTIEDMIAKHVYHGAHNGRSGYVHEMINSALHMSVLILDVDITTYLRDNSKIDPSSACIDLFTHIKTVFDTLSIPFTRIYIYRSENLPESKKESAKTVSIPTLEIYDETEDNDTADIDFDKYDHDMYEESGNSREFCLNFGDAVALANRPMSPVRKNKELHNILSNNGRDKYNVALTTKLGMHCHVVLKGGTVMTTPCAQDIARILEMTRYTFKNTIGIRTANGTSVFDLAIYAKNKDVHRPSIHGCRGPYQKKNNGTGTLNLYLARTSDGKDLSQYTIGPISNHGIVPPMHHRLAHAPQYVDDDENSEMILCGSVISAVTNVTNLLNDSYLSARERITVDACMAHKCTTDMDEIMSALNNTTYVTRTGALVKMAMDVHINNSGSDIKKSLKLESTDEFCRQMNSYVGVATSHDRHHHYNHVSQGIDTSKRYIRDKNILMNVVNDLWQENGSATLLHHIRTSRRVDGISYEQHLAQSQPSSSKSPYLLVHNQNDNSIRLVRRSDMNFNTSKQLPFCLLTPHRSDTKTDARLMIGEKMVKFCFHTVCYHARCLQQRYVPDVYMQIKSTYITTQLQQEMDNFYNNFSNIPVSCIVVNSISAADKTRESFSEMRHNPTSTILANTKRTSHASNAIHGVDWSIAEDVGTYTALNGDVHSLRAIMIGPDDGHSGVLMFEEIGQKSGIAHNVVRPLAYVLDTGPRGNTSFLVLNMRSGFHVALLKHDGSCFDGMFKQHSSMPERTGPCNRSYKLACGARDVNHLISYLKNSSLIDGIDESGIIRVI